MAGSASRSTTAAESFIGRTVMAHARLQGLLVFLVAAIGLLGHPRDTSVNGEQPPGRTGAGPFLGSKAGEEREVGGIKLCWCPAGKFTMGSPLGEPERRPGEDQVEVTLTRGFWVGKYEV